jgi:hypothetical protein
MRRMPGGFGFANPPFLYPDAPRILLGLQTEFGSESRNSNPAAAGRSPPASCGGWAAGGVSFGFKVAGIRILRSLIRAWDDGGAGSLRMTGAGADSGGWRPEIQNQRSRSTNYEVRITNYGLRITNYELNFQIRATSRLPAPRSSIPNAECRMPNAECNP